MRIIEIKPEASVDLLSSGRILVTIPLHYNMDTWGDRLLGRINHPLLFHVHRGSEIIARRLLELVLLTEFIDFDIGILGKEGSRDQQSSCHRSSQGGRNE